jgi:hypothetical protein
MRRLRCYATWAEKISGVQLLRIYWYDGTSSAPTAQHILIANKAWTKLRLGFVNTAGEQKGVDSLIVTDMISLARNRAMSDAVLLSGDEDLRVGVQQAQEFGVRVHLLGISPCKGNQSAFLCQEADSTIELGLTELSPVISYRPKPSGHSGMSQSVLLKPALTSGTSAPPTNNQNLALDLKQIALQAVSEMQINKALIPATVTAFAASKQLDQIFDRPLLGVAKKMAGRLLTRDELNALREQFVVELGKLS